MTEEKKERYVVGEVPSQYTTAVVDTAENKVFTIETAIAKIMNDIEELKKILH